MKWSKILLILQRMLTQQLIEGNEATPVLGGTCGKRSQLHFLWHI